MQCDIVCTRVRLSDTIKLETGFTAGKTTRRMTEAFHRKKKKCTNVCPSYKRVYDVREYLFKRFGLSVYNGTRVQILYTVAAADATNDPRYTVHRIHEFIVYAFRRLHHRQPLRAYMHLHTNNNRPMSRKDRVAKRKRTYVIFHVRIHTYIIHYNVYDCT